MPENTPTIASALASSKVVHGLASAASAKKVSGVIFWSLALLGSACLCALVLKPVTRQFYYSDYSLQPSITHADHLPAVLLCPSRLASDRILRDLGYPSELLPALNSIQYLGTTERKTEVLAKKWQLTNKSYVVQDVLRDIGEYLLKRVGVHVAKYQVVPIPMESSVQLVSFGYCLKYDPSKTKVPILGIQFGTFYQYITEELKDIGGFSLDIWTGELGLFPKQGPEYVGSCVVNIEVSVRSRRSNCDEFPTKYNDCVYQCLQSSVQCGACELYNPERNQSLTSVCLRTDECMKQMQTVSSTNQCSFRCNRPCRMVQYSKTIAVSTGGEGFLVNWAIRRADGVISLEEVPTIAFTQFFGYTGGNLGVFFGLNVVSLVMFVRSLCSKRKMRSGSAQVPNDRMFTLLVGLLLVISIVGFSTEVLKSFAEERSSSQIHGVRSSTFPPVFICDKWMDKEKLEKLIPWESEGSEREIERDWHDSGWVINSVPPMCEFIQSLISADPLQVSDTNMHWKYSPKYPKMMDRIDALTATLNNLLQNRSMSLTQLIKEIALPSEYFVQRIETISGRNLSFFGEPVVNVMGGICYKIQMDYSQLTHFDAYVGGVKLHLRVHTADPICRKGKGGRRLFVFTDSMEEAAASLQPLDATDHRHYSITVKSSVVTRVNTNRSPCASSDTRVVCSAACLRKITCKMCKYFLPGLQSEPIYNVTGLCSRFMNFHDNCFFMQLFTDEEALQSCEVECKRPCRQQFYSVKVQEIFFGRSADQLVHLRFDESLEALHLNEFLVYNFVSMLCTVGGLVSLFFGWSAITLFGLIIAGCQRWSSFR